MPAVLLYIDICTINCYWFWVSYCKCGLMIWCSTSDSKIFIFFDQFNMRLISQLINICSGFLQKWNHLFYWNHCLNFICAIVSCLPCCLLVKFKQNTIIVTSRKILLPLLPKAGSSL